MSLNRLWAIPLSLAMGMAVVAPGQSQPVTISPSSGTVQLTGTSGGPQQGDACAGNMAAAPNHVIQVTTDANLNFQLQSSGQPSLIIRTAKGKDFCVPADQFSNGQVSIPGRWQAGTYSIFVGDRANGRHPYTLSITSN